MIKSSSLTVAAFFYVFIYCYICVNQTVISYVKDYIKEIFIG